MRGKEVRALGETLEKGITPAYAGKSYQSIHGGKNCQDHPRLCGEKLLHLNWLCVLVGSPPPMRGKVVKKFPRCAPIGITPAYAGKSRFAHYGERGERDHPRLCGEKYRSTRRFFPSSRITPAYAGKRAFDGHSPMPF